MNAILLRRLLMTEDSQNFSRKETGEEHRRAKITSQLCPSFIRLIINYQRFNSDLFKENSYNRFQIHVQDEYDEERYPSKKTTYRQNSRDAAS